MLSNNLSRQNTVIKLLKLLGLPILFLFTFLGVFLLSYFHLLTLFTRQLLAFSKRLSRSIHASLFPPLPPLTLHHSPISTPFLPQHTHFTLPPLVISLLFSIFLFAAFFYSTILRDLPDPQALSGSLPSLSTKIYDRKGRLLYKIYRDENRTLVTLADLPPHLIQATIASEDESFYTHHGLSLRAIARAVVSNTSCFLFPASCTSLQGGSTITQQLVKNALLTPERTWRRKLKEAVLALNVERLYSKDQILELYLNYVPYGGTSYGVEEAAHYYFNKSARDLTLEESALLAGLPVSPTTLSPFGTHPYLAKSRQHQVLDRMALVGYLTKEQAFAAKETPIAFHAKGSGLLAPHFVMYVQDLLVEGFGKDTVYYGGLEVTTTLDLDLQQQLEQQIITELEKLTALNVSNGAGLILSPQDGEILAMVGSRDFFNSSIDGQVNLTLQPRQPGSAIKPLTYTLALERGLTPATILDDSPVCFTKAGQPAYCPVNYDGQFHGSVTLRTALASSYNIPAIKLLNGLGVDSLVQLGRSLGITTWKDSSRFGLALTLGGGEVTMLELAGAYAAFARGGSYLPSRAILRVTNHADLPSLNQTAAQSSSTSDQAGLPAGRQVFSETVAFQISDILSDNTARAPAFGFRSVLAIPGHQVAVKTGTSNDLRDNWTIGYTKDYLVATWVGNNDNSPMSRVASGITGASPIWSRTMQALLMDSPSHAFAPPTNLVRAQVSCPPNPRYEFVPKGSIPRLNCSPQGGEIL